MAAVEWQFDGLVGPTHNYAGLAMGNIAASTNAGQVSNPRLAALQGLEKMRFVSKLGMPQAFLPPHYRPVLSELARLGFGGDVPMMLDSAYKTAPGLLASIYSSAFMWTANAATVSPSTQTADGRVHLTPANLASHYHRSLEADFSYQLLNRIFHNKNYFIVHKPLPSVDLFGDEGAANHMLVNQNNYSKGLEIFAYGKSYEMTLNPKRYFSRQHRVACETVARQHQLASTEVLYLQQSPEAIDLGVFHNDVIAMNTVSHMVVHERAFVPKHQSLLRSVMMPYRLVEISDQELPISDAVSTYLFNSQLLFLPTQKYALVAPSECSIHAGVRRVVDRLLGERVIDEVHYLDVRESMRNGGGPACLRLRVIMNAEQAASIHQGVTLTDSKYNMLVDWVGRHYRDRLTFDDLRDPNLLEELERAYSDLEGILKMPDLYALWRH